MTKTRTVDDKGNITWHFSINGAEVGTATGFGGGWWVEETGREGGTTKHSVKAAGETIAFWRRMRGLAG